MAAMDVVFLGTCSAVPSSTRNVSSLSLRLANGDIWLFDTGEATQHQIGKSSAVRLSRVTRIFITHLHGDHLFGLPGLLCTMGQSRSNNSSVQADDANPDEEPPREVVMAQTPVEIVGPVGLRHFIRASLQLSHSQLAFPVIIHELHWKPPANDDTWRIPPLATELVDRQQDIVPSNSSSTDSDHPLWTIPGNDGMQVLAGAIDHSVPTVGYVISEPPAPGSLNAAVATQRLEANKASLIAEGVKNPMSLLSSIKAGKTVKLPDGTVLDPAELVGPPVPGRKVVILGDTFNATSLAEAARDCDLLVHEATNAHLSSDDDGDVDQEAQVQALAVSHGHSTPQMAGQFARAVGAKSLCLTHFSSRYKGDTAPASVAVMEQIANLARREYKTGPVVCARDLMVVSVSRKGGIAVDGQPVTSLSNHQ